MICGGDDRSPGWVESKCPGSDVALAEARVRIKYSMTANISCSPAQNPVLHPRGSGPGRIPRRAQSRSKSAQGSADSRYPVGQGYELFRPSPRRLIMTSKHDQTEFDLVPELAKIEAVRGG